MSYHADWCGEHIQGEYCVLQKHDTDTRHVARVVNSESLKQQLEEAGWLVHQVVFHGSLSIGQGDNPYERAGHDVFMDCRKFPGIDVVGKWEHNLFPEGTFNRVYSNQVIEHLSLVNQKVAIANSYMWLQPGGALELWTPDIEIQARWAVAGDITWDWFRMIAYGEQDYPENAHLWCHNEASLRELVSELFNITLLESVSGSLHLIALKG